MAAARPAGHQEVALRVNGVDVTATVPSRTLLARFLREDLELTGTHIGCDTSQCGACTVLLDGVAVKACTILAAQAGGHEVTTIEGLCAGASGDLEERLHPVQRAFWDYHGLQCGYCTPGMVLAIVSLLADNPDPTEDEVRAGIAGNLCRCTGYQNIVDAALAAAGELRAS